jgi:CRP/FNR family transcriptional regulator, cyclic AMP receptor protein
MIDATPTAPTAQSPARGATNTTISANNWSVVTNLPDHRARNGTFRNHEMLRATRNPMAVARSRANRMKYCGRVIRPVARSTATAVSTNIRSAIGSSIAPNRVTACRRRAIQPSRTSDNDAAPISATRVSGAGVARNATAMANRDIDTRFGNVKTGSRRMMAQAIVLTPVLPRRAICPSLTRVPTPPTTIELLRAQAIFAGLDEHELSLVGEICREQRFISGEAVFREGEIGDRLFLVIDGSIRVTRQIPGSGEEALAVLKPGSLFGEMAVLDHGPRSTDAIANSDATCLTIYRSDFELLLQRHRDVAVAVLWAVVRLLSKRLRATNDSLQSFLAMSMF